MVEIPFRPEFLLGLLHVAIILLDTFLAQSYGVLLIVYLGSVSQLDLNFLLADAHCSYCIFLLYLCTLVFHLVFMHLYGHTQQIMHNINNRINFILVLSIVNSFIYFYFNRLCTIQLHGMTWYGRNSGTQIMQWDFQNKGTLTSPARLSFVWKSHCIIFVPA